MDFVLTQRDGHAENFSLSVRIHTRRDQDGRITNLSIRANFRGA
jgi:hypothetical protein